MILADTDDEVLAALGSALAGEDYDVVEARTGSEVLDAVTTHRPDAVVIDIGPLGGLDVLRALRADMMGPIMVLSAKNDETDRVVGLYSGADDYIGKPFSAREVVARVSAHLRRVDALTAPSPRARTTELDGIRINHDARRAYVDGTEVMLTPREFSLLSVLVENAGKVQSVDTLLGEVWGRVPTSESAMRADSNTLKVHIYGLREKLAKCPSVPVRITTVFKGGYRLDVIADEMRARVRHRGGG